MDPLQYVRQDCIDFVESLKMKVNYNFRYDGTYKVHDRLYAEYLNKYDYDCFVDLHEFEDGKLKRIEWPNDDDYDDFYEYVIIEGEKEIINYVSTLYILQYGPIIYRYSPMYSDRVTFTNLEYWNIDPIQCKMFGIEEISIYYGACPIDDEAIDSFANFMRNNKSSDVSCTLHFGDNGLTITSSMDDLRYNQDFSIKTKDDEFIEELYEINRQLRILFDLKEIEDGKEEENYVEFMKILSKSKKSARSSFVRESSNS